MPPKNEKIFSNALGLTILEVVIAFSLLSVVALYILSLVNSIFSAQKLANNSADMLEMGRHVDLVISNNNTCKASFAGLSFQGSLMIDPANASHGVDVEFWRSDLSGNRTQRIFRVDGGKTYSGGIEIVEAKLYLPDAPGDYPENPYYSEIGDIVVTGRKKIGKDKFNNIKKTFHTRVSFATDAGGVSTIVDCQGQGQSSGGGSGLTIVAVHSQSMVGNPPCPDGWTKLWVGYSFMSATIHGTPSAQDMSNSGSCLPIKGHSPVKECQNSAGGQCRHYSGSDRSVWLAGHDSAAEISTCAVCSFDKPIVTVHSQTAAVPSCPPGFSPIPFTGYPGNVWTGYSFAGHTTEDARVTTSGSLTEEYNYTAMQDLSGPGSCLKYFKDMTPIVDCGPHIGGSHCERSHEHFISYLSTTPTSDTPHTEMNYATNQALTSRCQVCQLQ